MAGVCWNFLVYWFRFGSDTWGLLLPLAKPTGIDFRDGLYVPAQAFSQLVSGWPPLPTLILGGPSRCSASPPATPIQVGVLVGRTGRRRRSS